jgi:hypothetical protein
MIHQFFSSFLEVRSFFAALLAGRGLWWGEGAKPPENRDLQSTKKTCF